MAQTLLIVATPLLSILSLITSLHACGLLPLRSDKNACESSVNASTAGGLHEQGNSCDELSSCELRRRSANVCISATPRPWCLHARPRLSLFTFGWNAARDFVKSKHCDLFSNCDTGFNGPVLVPPVGLADVTFSAR
ncbi:hypothetical protein AVEN_81800-1 [Araneus ventricosus]|uniref:Secreted protein n=1 Tax=Araneus ventricosus TaxID=182803 RepID=A0A4Y2TRL3_ARAVE|nr:hypothetical protein AVEN_81800-1 [Araneus ventricosus]